MPHTPGLARRVAIAAGAIRDAEYVVAFTGAGVSVESGVPPFRGPSGLWSSYDPIILDIGYFSRNPAESWRAIREIFYEFIGSAQPNPAHVVLADWERRGIIQAVITQNIDGLHQAAGSRRVAEYHGTSRRLVCRRCRKSIDPTKDVLAELPPLCSCGRPLRPDFVFFGEPIPEDAERQSREWIDRADVVLIVGSTGEVYPASLLPHIAARRGATIIEVDPAPTAFTDAITDIHLVGEAGTVLPMVDAALVSH
jgi:NAD-dependent deacetylase